MGMTVSAVRERKKRGERAAHGECNNDYAEVLQLKGLTKRREAAGRTETQE